MRTIACSFIITIDAKNKGKATNNGPPINDLRLSVCKRIKPRYRVVVLCRTVQQHALDMVPSHVLSRHSNVLVGILVRMPDDSSAYLDCRVENIGGLLSQKNVFCAAKPRFLRSAIERHLI